MPCGVWQGAAARPRADEARLVGGNPPKGEKPRKHTRASNGARVKLEVRWTKPVRLDNLAELEKYEALIRTPLGDCQQVVGIRSPGDADTQGRPPCTCAEYFGMDEGAYSPETTADSPSLRPIRHRGLLAWPASPRSS